MPIAVGVRGVLRVSPGPTARIAAALTLTGVAGLLVPGRLALVGVLALGPMAACARLSPARTAALGGYGVGWAAIIGLSAHALSSAQFLMPMAVTAAVSLVAVGVARTRSGFERRTAALRRLASLDTVTGLDSRRAVLEYANGMAALRPPRRPPLALALLDLDHFKQVNDRYGHLAGDAVLAEVGRRIRQTLRGSDRAGRYGGEELLVVLPDTDEAGALRLVERLLATIRATPVATEAGPVTVTSSAGVAAGGSVDHLLARADSALYAAKAAGRDRAVVAPRHLALPAEPRSPASAGRPAGAGPEPSERPAER